MSSAGALLLPGSNQPDHNNGPTILAATGIMTLLALTAVIARLWVRVSMVRSVGLDDYAILLAMAIAFTGMGLIIPEVANGAGRHIAYLDPAVATLGLKYNFATQPVFLWAITVVKISIALFLLRIAPTKFYRQLLWGIIFFLVVYTTACFMTLILQCTNLAILWDSTTKATCWAPTTVRALSYTNVALNIATDLLFAILPIPMLWNLQINSRTKASLICIMGLGVFACVAAIVKTSFIPNYGKTGDFLWDSTNLTIWTVTECDTGIIAACLPCLKPLFKKILDRSRYYGSGADRYAHASNYHSRGGKNSHALRSLPTGGAPSMPNNGQNGPSAFGRSKVTTHTTVLSVGDGSADNSSVESILPIQRKSNDIGITKTVVVNVDREDGDRSVGKLGGWDNDNRVQRSQRNEISLNPETRVEDRV